MQCESFKWRQTEETDDFIDMVTVRMVEDSRDHLTARVC